MIYSKKRNEEYPPVSKICRQTSQDSLSGEENCNSEEFSLNHTLKEGKASCKNIVFTFYLTHVAF